MNSSCSYIYGLFDPDSGECRYVGKSDEPDERLKQHLIPRRKNQTYCANWIRSLKACGRQPKLQVLSMAFPQNGESWEDVEREWIACYRKKGHRLTNLTPGGDGRQKGSKLRPELIKKWRAVKIGTRLSPQTCEKIAASKRGKPRPEEVKERIRQKLLGRKLPPEHIANIIKNHPRTKWTEERKAYHRRLPFFQDPAYRAKLSAAMKGRQIGPEWCRKISEGRKGKGRWTPEIRARVMAGREAANIRRAQEATVAL